jgi:hypothetical protein
MNRLYRTTLALAAVALILPRVGAAQDASKAVSGGGISVQGWTGKVDAREAQGGLTLESAKFEKEGNALHVTTGPAVTYWNPANKAAGNYTVKATFKEAKFMGLNDHAHPYGIVIAGNDLGTDQQSLFYCASYGDGRFIAAALARRLSSSTAAWVKRTLLLRRQPRRTSPSRTRSRFRSKPTRSSARSTALLSAATTRPAS